MLGAPQSTTLSKSGGATTSRARSLAARLRFGTTSTGRRRPSRPNSTIGRARLRHRPRRVLLCRVEFWGGKSAEFRCRLVAQRPLDAAEDFPPDLLMVALGLEAAPDTLIPIFDEAELHRRNAEIVRLRHLR